MRDDINGDQASFDGAAGTIEVFGVVVAATARAVVTVHQRDGQPRKKEAKANYDAIARALKEQIHWAGCNEARALQAGKFTLMFTQAQGFWMNANNSW